MVVLKVGGRQTWYSGKLDKKPRVLFLLRRYRVGTECMCLFCAALRANTVLDFAELGIGSLYHYCCLLGNHARGQWCTYIVGKDLKAHDSAGKSPTLSDRDGEWAAWC